MMKTVFIIVLLLCPLGVLAVVEENIDYKSHRVHYYVSYRECVNPLSELDFETVYLNGTNVWVLMELYDGNVIFERRPWGNFQYGIIPGTNQTGQFSRKQSIEYLNSWINSHYSLVEQNEKYNGDPGYSVAYYEITGIKKECYIKDSLNVGFEYVHSGRFTNGVEMNLWVNINRENVILYPSGTEDLTLFVELDIEYYLPKY